MQISISDSFLSAIRALDPVDAKRVTAFAEKLIVSPETSGLRTEIVHEAPSRAVRSLRVTHDMRAIAQLQGNRLLLMFVAQHDDAYAWARNHCVDCIAGHDEVRVRLTPVGPDGERRVDLAADARTWIVETIEQLEALFGEFGVAAAGA